MTNWDDPSVIAFCGFIYNQIAVFLLGFFGNHVLTRMDIEWSLITRKRRFSPVLIPYLFGRYSILVTLLVFVLTNRFHQKVACDALYKSLALLGSAASYCSTMNLGIRSYIIWKDMNRLVIWVLSIACIGHAALVGVQASESVTFTWNSQTQACAVVRSSHVTMFVFYLYTMIMDLAILILTVCGLWRKGALRSAIGASLSEQCLWYVVGTFVVTIPAVVLPALNLNVIMNVIASMPATTFSVVMSSAAVLSLKPEEVSEMTSSATTMTHPTEHAHGIILGGIMQHPRHHNITLTTNIMLESRADSAALESRFDVRSHGKTEESDETVLTPV
ncbi:hypothetical protein L226DRAFT_529978 [Lentinus tigrinus ALCF2SS1-7]|uniref:G-protein coupled receptors family 1 profile domain-containing protein n=1 Tax=Lentinus tigrinus ALCF2SS1-6 TaxID=1328759 RepID=A0A5C2SR70_9APHY|nr:hypothetical protein L227DRAFT_648672 [Lentinus tigrinus ALCF2SS1-6]RPD79779.1 hypothetical protein L226DRAFT_529978 [Lentinus tigrinus ALCF2SS1-7]